MANELTWIEMRNHVVEDYSSVTALYKNIIFDLKQFLKGAVGYETNGSAGVWTVLDSSDGVGGFGASDLWVSPANVVRATSGNHSWIRLGNSSLGLQCVIDVVGGDNHYPMALYFAPTFNVAGTAIARPTSTYEFGHDASGSYRWIHNNSATPMKIHGLLSTRGDFWFFTSHDASGAVYSGMGVCKLQGAQTGDSFPWASFFRGNANFFTRACFCPNEPAGEGPHTGSIGARAWSGTAQAPWGSIWPVMGSTNAYGNMHGPLDGNGPAGSDGLSLLFPFWIAIGGSTDNSDFKGRWPDTFFGFTGIPTNMAAPIVAAQEKLKVAAVWLPFASGRFTL